MKETYAFLFCTALGIAARFLYMAASALAKRTDLIPVTVVLDALTAATVGSAFILYVILTGTVIAPYLFAALFSGYFLTYLITRTNGKKRRPEKKKKAAKHK